MFSWAFSCLIVPTLLLWQRLVLSIEMQIQHKIPEIDKFTQTHDAF